METRHKELLELEGRIRDIHELFFQMAQLVEEQGCMLDNIEANVGATQDYVVKATVQITRAVKYKKNNPCKKLFCCCFPVWRCIISYQQYRPKLGASILSTCTDTTVVGRCSSSGLC
uniref:t-SNARE coiled-coil homology domain-containing protein n=1 Tax=Cyclopterus lumpus TaxID=8103 RepID=A0A8C3G5L2_CYCLU